MEKKRDKETSHSRDHKLLDHDHELESRDRTEKIRQTHNKGLDHVKDNTFPQAGFNYMSDILYLPTTRQKYRYLLTMVDI